MWAVGVSTSCRPTNMAFREDITRYLLRSSVARHRLDNAIPGYFPSWRGRAEVAFCFYMFRGKRGLETKQLLPPEYIPIYRHWDWYARASEGGTWSDPYVDEGGGEIPMVTFSMPFERRGPKAGVGHRRSVTRVLTRPGSLDAAIRRFAPVGTARWSAVAVIRD